MSGVLRPVGHLPASVYWVRRALVLTLLTALILLLPRILGGGSDPAANTAAPVPSPTPSSVGTTVSMTPTTAPTAPGDSRCGSGDARILAMPAVRRLPAGRGMNLHVRMSAVQGSCTATIDATRLVVTITSGRDRIWTTAHCIRTVSRATVVLTAGRDTTITVPWTGNRSVAGCAPGQPFAKRGTYVVQAWYALRYSTAQAFYVV